MTTNDFLRLTVDEIPALGFTLPLKGGWSSTLRTGFGELLRISDLLTTAHEVHQLHDTDREHLGTGWLLLYLWDTTKRLADELQTIEQPPARRAEPDPADLRRVAPSPLAWVADRTDTRADRLLGVVEQLDQMKHLTAIVARLCEAQKVDGLKPVLDHCAAVLSAVSAILYELYFSDAVPED